MRCQFSIWRCSFLGICPSKLIGASGCTMNGAKVAVSAPGCASISFCQCACDPSPRHETMPTPVIQASRAASAISGRLDGKSYRCRPVAHLPFHFRIGEIEHAQRQRGVANQFALGPDFRLDDRVAGPVMLQTGVDRQQLAGLDEGAQLRLFHRGEERHALEAVSYTHLTLPTIYSV